MPRPSASFPTSWSSATARTSSRLSQVEFAGDPVGSPRHGLRVHERAVHQHLEMRRSPGKLGARQWSHGRVDPGDPQRGDGVGDVDDRAAARERLRAAQDGDGQPGVALDGGHELPPSVRSEAVASRMRS